MKSTLQRQFVCSITLILGCCTFSAAEEKKEGTPNDAWKALEGRWRKNTVINRGFVVDVTADEVEIVITQHQLNQTFVKGKLLNDDVVERFVIDASKTPAHIDFLSKPPKQKESVWMGIYEVRDDKLRIVFPIRDRSRRPEKLEFFKDDPLDPCATEYIRLKENQK